MARCQATSAAGGQCKCEAGAQQLCHKHRPSAARPTCSRAQILDDVSKGMQRDAAMRAIKRIANGHRNPQALAQSILNMRPEPIVSPSATVEIEPRAVKMLLTGEDERKADRGRNPDRRSKPIAESKTHE